MFQFFAASTEYFLGIYIAKCIVMDSLSKTIEFSLRFFEPYRQDC